MQRNQTFRECTVTQALEALCPFSLSAFCGLFKFIWFLRAPAPCDGLERIDQGRFADDFQLPQTHQERHTAHAIDAFQIKYFFKAKRVAVSADFFQEMLSGHKERARKQGGGLLLFLFVQAVSIDQAVCKLMSEGQASPLQ